MKKENNVLPGVPIPDENKLRVEDYNNYSIAVFGDASYGDKSPVREKLFNLGGRFNWHLKFNGRVLPGWVLPMSKKKVVKNLIAKHQ